MKAIKILSFVIIGILVVGIGIGAYIYFYTDTFKTNKEIFYKYATEEQLSKIIDFDPIQQALTRIKNESSEQNLEININASMEEQNILNNASILAKSKINPKENKAEISLIFGNANKKDILEMNGVYNNERFGISFKDITQKYIAVENKNLDQFLEKVGITNLATNTENIETSDYTNQIKEELKNSTTKWTELFTQIAEKAPKEKYSNLGKTQIEFNGANVEAKAYELKLSKEEIQQIYSQQANETSEQINPFNLSQIIYVYQEKLVKTEITMDIYDSTDINTQKIQISKTFGQQNDNLTIQIENKENEMNIIIDATKSENDKYSINLGITSADIEVSADVNIDIKFDSNITITELTDSNSVIINDKSSEEINQIIQTAVKLIQEKEGIEDTVLGVFQSIITMNEELFEKATNAAKEAENAIEAEQQLSQGMEQLDEMVRTTNN